MIRRRKVKHQRRNEKRERQRQIKEDFAGEEGVPLFELCVSKCVCENQLIPCTSASRCTKWANDEVRGRFRDFISRRDAAYAEEFAKRKDAKRALALERAEEGQGGRLGRLQDAVASIFASRMMEELQEMRRGKSVSGLGAKWAPSTGSRFDKACPMLVDSIIAALPEEALATRGSTDRIRYQQLLSTIRKAAKIPESFARPGFWDQVDYKRMPGLCRTLYGEKLYKKHDEERYNQYLAECRMAAMAKREGKSTDGPKVNAGGVLPHQLVAASQSGDHAADLQWMELVLRCREAREGGAGAAPWLPVCDVSGSMNGEPMDVAIALSLLMAEAGEGGKICTFHESPKLVDVPGLPKTEDGFLGSVGDLGRRADFVKGIDWGMSTDIDRVWDLLIEEALEQGWGPETVAAMKVVVSTLLFSPHSLPHRGIANLGVYIAPHTLLVTTLIKFGALQRRILPPPPLPL